jgi:hypothetical protein
MSSPTVYWQAPQSGNIPPGDISNRNQNRWTEEAEFGTELRGAGGDIGLFLGSLTNGTTSDDFGLVVSHDALNEVTNCKVYFQPTTVDRVGGVGFTHTPDEAGAQADFDELKTWGDKQKDLDDALPSGESGGLFLYPMFAVPPLNTESEWALRNGNMESVATAKDVDDTFYYNGINNVGANVGTIQPFVDFVSADALFLTTKIIVPESLETAGARQASIVLRFTYTF